MTLPKSLAVAPRRGRGIDVCVDHPVASDSGDVGGEEVDAVAVEVAAGAVVVLGGAGVGMPGKDLRVAEGDPGIEGR